MPRQRVDFLLQSFDPPAVSPAELGQPVDVDLHPVGFQLDQHVDQRELQFGEQLQQVRFFQLRCQDGAEPQRQEGVLAGVVNHLADRDLVHPLLLLAAADQLADLDRGVVEVPFGQLVEAMVPLARIQEVAGDHGVEGHPGQPDPGRAEHDHVVLEVLADLLDGRVFEHRPQGLERRFGLQAPLALRSADRQVPGLVVGPGEREAHDLGPAGPDAGRLGVERNARLTAQFGQEGFQGLGGVDQAVLGIQLRLRWGRFVLQGVDLFGQAVEAELAEEVPGPIAIEAAHAPGVPVDFHRHVGVEPHQVATQQCLPAVLDQVLLALGAGDVLGVIEDRFQGAVLFEQLAGELGPDQRHARHVVDRIAHQGLEIDDLLGRDTPNGLEGLALEDLVLADVVKRHPIGDQLPAVLVAGDHEAAAAQLVGPSGDGGQEVVGLVRLESQGRDSQGVEHPTDRPDLRH